MRLDDHVAIVLTRAGGKQSEIVQRMISNGAEMMTNEIMSATYEGIKKTRPDAPYHSMRELYGSLEGKTVFVCGSGPSLLKSPVKLPGPTFAINRAITHVAADFWCFSDMEAWRLYGEYENAKNAKKCFGSGMHVYLQDVPGYLIEAVGSPLSYLVEAKRPLYSNLATFSWVVHLAIKAGAARIVCIGTEFSTDKYFDGFQPKDYEGDKVNALLAISKARMEEMFGPDKNQWYERPVALLDASDGSLPIPKTKLEDWL